MDNQNTPNSFEELKQNPVFQLSLASKELFHSNFLYWLSQDESLKEVFQKVINGLCGEGNGINWEEIGDYVVLREFKNFDLCICKKKDSLLESEEKDSDSDDDEENGNNDYNDVKAAGEVIFVLENKFKSIAYKEQLDRYEQKIQDYNQAINNRIKSAAKKEIEKLRKKIRELLGESRIPRDLAKLKEIINNSNILNDSKNILDYYSSIDEKIKQNSVTPQKVLLTLATYFSSKSQIENDNKWTIKSYSVYSQILTKSLDGLPCSFSRCLIEKYIAFISKFSDAVDERLQNVNCTKKWNNLFEGEDFKNIRCNDIWQKLVMHKINGVLLSYLQGLNVCPDSTDSYIKELVEKEEEEKKKTNKKNSNDKQTELPLIYSGVQFLHGEGIIEVKYLVKDGESYDYTICIQQQGCSLCVGVAFFSNRKNYITESRPKKNEDAEEPNGKTNSAWDNWQGAIRNFVNKHIKDKFSALPIKPDQEFRAYESEKTGYYYQTFYLDKKSQPNLIPKKADKEGSQNSTTTQNNGNSSVEDTLKYMVSVINKIHKQVNQH